MSHFKPCLPTLLTDLDSEGVWENVLPVIIGGTSVGATMGALLVLMLKSTKQQGKFPVTTILDAAPV